MREVAERQGDPGSSRFYLSMEDELMRLFGGQQAEGLMQRMKIDEMELLVRVAETGSMTQASPTCFLPKASS